MSGRFRVSFRLGLKWFFLACLSVGAGLGLVGRHYVLKRLEKVRHERRLAALPLLEEGGVIQFRGDQVVQVDPRHDSIDPRWSAALADVPEIERLHVFQSSFSDEDARHLTGLRKMTEILAYKTPLADAALVHLRHMHELETLDLRGTEITGIGLHHLEQLPKLKKLNLSETRVDDTGLAALGRVAGLEELYLSLTPIRGSGLCHLKGLTKIRILEIFMPALDEVSGLDELDQIESLELAGPGLNKRHIDQIAGMASLRVLSLSAHQFDRPLLTEISRLRGLEGIRLYAMQPLDDPRPRIRWDDMLWLSRQMPDTNVQFELGTDGMQLHPSLDLTWMCNQRFTFRNGGKPPSAKEHDSSKPPDPARFTRVRIQSVFPPPAEATAVTSAQAVAGP